jgi:hypothetical protein
MTDPTASPLSWPPGWRRTPAHRRTSAKFGKGVREKSSYSENYYTRKREHPDSGGSNEAMSRVNVARDAMLAARP